LTNAEGGEACAVDAKALHVPGAVSTSHEYVNALHPPNAVAFKVVGEVFVMDPLVQLPGTGAIRAHTSTLTGPAAQTSFEIAGYIVTCADAVALPYSGFCLVRTTV
jgi:hypothetical protein